MQTFLPWPDFAASAEVLDARRLGKQRVEALQVLRGLTVPGYGWRHHPAVRMWTGYEEALVRYGLEICRTWTDSGHQDTCALTLTQDYAATFAGSPPRPYEDLASTHDLPNWLGDPAFHESHRSALLTKDPTHYTPHFPDTPPGLPYVWPTSDRAPTPTTDP
ncbi:MSMEG_6728 family protein [Streptomyces olivaceiscleroticus]|uniref:MSMEG_6728 family protein n=1 Tax=Streptomyces olivaceiscleroticus TaxID=68245 RepID=A0ABP3KWB6_9ACTN